MIRLVQADFRRWLRRNGGKIVGDPNEPSDCPFCRFLKSQGAKKVWIDIPQRRVDGEIHTHSKWQRDFQHNAIRLKRELVVADLRGREALIALDEATQ